MSNPYQQVNGYNPAQLNPALFASLTSQQQQQISNAMQPQLQQGNINMNQLQQQQQQQQQQKNPNNPNGPNDLNGALQNIMLPMFNRLQGQNVARMEQQRLGINPPNAQQQTQQQQPNPQQQFQGMAQPMNMAGLPGMNMMNPQQPQQQQQPNPHQPQLYNQQQQPLPQPQPQQGYSIHSQQQGLALQPNPAQQQQQPTQQQQQQQMQNMQGMNQMGMVGDSEQGRRLMLSNMLSQATSNTHTPVQNQQPQPQQQLPMRPQQPQQQPQPNQQAMQAQQLGNVSSINPQITELFRNRPDLAQAVMKKHGGNMQLAMEDLQRTITMMTNTQQQRAREAQAQVQQQQQQVQQQQAQQQQQQQVQQQQPIGVGINGQLGVGMGYPSQMPNQQQPNQQQPPQRPPSQQQMHQPQPQQHLPQPQPQQPRIVSDNGQFNMGQGQQGNQYANTLSQLEALQQMKERQQRSGLKTPQMQQPNLPMASPQQPMPNVNPSVGQAGLGVNMNQPYQMLQQNLSQSQVPQIQGQGQAQRPTPQMAQQQLGPPPQRPQAQPHQQSQIAPTQSTPQMQTPTLASGSMAPPTTTSSGSNNRMQYFEQIPSWPNDKLINAASLIAKKLYDSLQSGNSGANEQLSKFHLLLLVAEIKKRGLVIPQDALSVATAFMSAPNATQALMNMDPNMLLQVANSNISRLMGNQSQGQGQQQPLLQQQQPQQQPQISTQPQHARQRSYQGQPPQQGSQNNPIELITPTMNQMTLPPQFSTPVQQNTGPQQQQQQPQQFVPPPQAPGQQQQQWLPNPASQPQQQQSQNTAPPPPSVGFESMNLPEENFWHTLKQLHPNINVQNPIIEGKPLNLHKLFQIVLKNGGSAKIDPSRWTIVAGQSGLALDPVQPNQPQPLISTPNAAQQARACYAQVLQPLENLFMARIQQSRQNVGQPQQQQQAQAQQQQQQQQSQQQPIQQQQQFQQPPQQQVNPSPQIAQGHLSNSQSQVPQLSEQQKRFLEAAKNAGPGTGTLEGLAQQVVPQQTQQQSAQPTQPASAATQDAPQSQSQVQNQSQSQAQGGFSVKGNPLKIYEFIKTQETQVRAKLEKNPSIPGVDREAYRNELNQLMPIIKEAETRVPMFLMMMQEMGAPEMSAGPQIVSMYTSALYANSAAETERYILNVSDLHRIKLGLAQLMARAQSMYRALMDKPGGSMMLKDMASALNKAKLQFIAQNQAQSQSQSQQQGQNQGPLTGNQSIAQLQPVGSSPANLAEAIAARHKSLRVEDLKPPPAKRAKGAKGSPATPSGSGPGQTPESVKTPALSNMNQMGTPTDSPSSVKKSGGKRKRQSSNAVNSATALQNVTSNKTPKELMAEVKESMMKGPSTSTAKPTITTTAPPDLSLPNGDGLSANALGIDLTPNEIINQVELDQNKNFFDNQTQLNLAAGILPHVSSGTSQQGEADLIAGLPLDTWQIFTQAYEAFQASQVEANQLNSLGNIGTIPAHNNGNSMMVNGITGVANGNGNGGGKDDMFEQFIDVSQLTEELPTPELFRTNSNLLEGGEESDNSPESIKTVGSTSVPLVPHTAQYSHNASQNQPGLDNVKTGNEFGLDLGLGLDHGSNDLGGASDLGMGMGLMMGSEESGMYNGGIWWGGGDGQAY
ncbi:hypothetical protein I302_103814 [Kwoniella bestiolae CBS 10118]|uniref:ARID domain-containing protein n=1 Tax=Kwoniella bestiolae CBS 10118 TaxID=1296100 RepID=A0AAJ8K6U2_9TREE